MNEFDSNMTFEWMIRSRSASVGATNEEEASLEPDSLEPPLRFVTLQPEGSGNATGAAAALAQVPETAAAMETMVSFTEDNSWAPQFPSTTADEDKP